MKNRLILAFGVLLLALTVSGCGGRRAAAGDENEKVAVRVTEAVGKVVRHEVEFTANIEPWQKNYIIPALQGARIDRIYVNVGDRVKRGQLVAEMDPTQYNAARVQFETAAADYRRVKTVFDAGGVSEQQLQQAEAQYLVYKETVENLARNVKLLSPTDGVVTRRPEEEGNLFTSTPILEIMQIDRLKVDVNISEQFFTSVGVGTEVVLSVDIYPGETFPGRVCLIYPAIDAATRTFRAEIEIPNPHGKLRPGMFARCTANMGDRNGVIVTDIAVQRQIGTSERFVYVIRDGAAEKRFVSVGRLADSRYEILSGIEAGEIIATTSFSRLDDGTEVEIIAQ